VVPCHCRLGYYSSVVLMGHVRLRSLRSDTNEKAQVIL
jgi:hypothetical protein